MPRAPIQEKIIMNRLRTRALTAAVALAATAGLLAACGTTEEKTDAAAPTATNSGPVTVTDSRGKAVELKAPAKRVVGLEWGELEMLVSLGIQPVGAADPKGYATWVKAAPLPADVKDVGTRQEPSVDSIVALQPDLVVMEAERDAPLVTQLEKYVPIIVTKGSDASDNLGRMRSDLNMIAQATGTTDKAAALLADLDKAIADGKAKIAAAGNAGKGYAMADGWKQGSAVNVRMYGKGALVSELAVALGLTNVWTGKVDAAWGLGTTDVEGLLAVKDADAKFFYNASDGNDVFADGLAGNKIWESLNFVKNKQVTKLPAGIWTFGGPKSCMQYIDELVKAYGA